MTNNGYNVLLLDFDGTLVSTLDSFVYSAGKALESMGFRVSLELLYTNLTKPFDRVVEKLVGPLDATVRRELVDRYIEVYNTEGYKYSKPNSGAFEVLDRLANWGVKLGIVTSRSLLHDSIQKTLEYLSLAKYVNTLITARDVPKPKPYPDQYFLALRRLGGTPSNTLSVGDSPEDIEGSRSAGIRVAAYTKGFYTYDQLVVYRPDYVLHELSDLLQLFE
ncbi:MAG: HAD-IA family hydrolase [Thermoprotei archaeon]